MKKTIALFLTLAMIFVALTACSDLPTTVGMSTTEKTTSSKTDDSTQSGIEVNPTGLPIVDEPLTTMSMLVQISETAVPPEENYCFQKLEEITNIKWEYQSIESASWKEKLSLIWMSDELPDTIYSQLGGGTSEVLRLLNMGKIIDIEPYLETYAPDFYQIVQQNDNYRRAVYTPDGQVGSFTFGAYAAGALTSMFPEYLDINTLWLNKVGFDMPKNANELHDILVAFRDGDPNENGEADEIPLAFSVWSVNRLRVVFPWFGVMADKQYNSFIFEDKAYFTPLTDEYRQAVQYLNKLYSEKLIDKDIFSITGTDVVAKGSGEEHIYGAVISSGTFSVIGAEKAKDFDLPGPFTADNGRTIWHARLDPAGVGCGCITSSCEYPEAVIRWYNLFYTDEYHRLYWMGFEGDAYSWIDDDKWDWKYENIKDPSIEKVTTETMRNYFTLHRGYNGGPSICPVDWFKLDDEIEGPANRKRFAWCTENAECLHVPIPMMYYEEDVLSRLTELAADINVYEEDMFAKFVIGELNPHDDATWEDFTSQLRAMGGEEIETLLQKTYDMNN